MAQPGGSRPELADVALNRGQLEEALDIAARAYRLMRWVGEGIERGFLTFGSAHDYASDAGAAAAWIAEHYGNIPPAARPSTRQGAAFDRFTNYFATYLTTSFEILADPGIEVRSYCGCRCWCCTYLAAAPNLKTRRLTPKDKKRAARLKVDCLQQLALDRHLSVPESTLEALATDAVTTDQVALLAYTGELLRRCSGQSSGPASLVLWRQFAWSPSGSPKPGFELRADTILQAEAQIARALEKTVA